MHVSSPKQVLLFCSYYSISNSISCSKQPDHTCEKKMSKSPPHGKIQYMFLSLSPYLQFVDLKTMFNIRVNLNKRNITVYLTYGKLANAL